MHNNSSKANLEVSINGIKLLWVLGQLSTDVLWADEDALEVWPCPLDFKPDGNDWVSCGQLLLPVGHLLQEVTHKLGCHHVLQLDLGGEGRRGRRGGGRERRQKRSAQLVITDHPQMYWASKKSSNQLELCLIDKQAALDYYQVYLLRVQEGMGQEDHDKSCQIQESFT